METVQGYVILKAATFETGHGFALGHNPGAPSPFVTWQFTEGENGHRDYYWGRYGTSQAWAQRDFDRRVDDYQQFYHAAVKHTELGPEGVYRYYSTQRPVDIGTYPKPPDNQPLSIVNYDDDRRRPVADGRLMAWGELTYDLQDVLSAIEGKEKRPGRSERKISLAVDIQAKLAAGKGPGYERWAKVFNIKQMAAALAYIQDNNLTDYEQLAKKATEAADRFHVISEQVKQTEQAMKTNAGLKAATVQYAKTRPVFEQYKATKYSRKFLAEHEADLELYRAAQAEMRSLLGGAKLPKMDVLKEEGRKLTAKKKQLYGEYQKARRDMQEIVTIKANIDTLMGYTEPGRKQEKER